MKDINNISQLDKDNLFQQYTDILEIPESFYEDIRFEFYEVFMRIGDIRLMPHWLVVSLYELGYNIELK